MPLPQSNVLGGSGSAMARRRSDPDAPGAPSLHIAQRTEGHQVGCVMVGTEPQLACHRSPPDLQAALPCSEQSVGIGLRLGKLTLRELLSSRPRHVRVKPCMQAAVTLRAGQGAGGLSARVVFAGMLV